MYFTRYSNIVNTKQSQSKICFNGMNLGSAMRQQKINPENFFGTKFEDAPVVHLLPTNQQGTFGLIIGGRYN